MSEFASKALAVRQPYALAICAGVKRTENRSWTINYRGTIAIHASTSRQEVREMREDTDCELMRPECFHFGAIIGLADIVDVSVYGPQFCSGSAQPEQWPVDSP